MNNRYIFRGKRKDNGEWIEGWITTQYKKGFDGEILFTRIKSNIFGGGEHLVDTETVGQCTGLKDKNGKLIFEGDVVKLVDATNGIEWNGYIVFGNPYGEYNWGWNIMRISGDSNVNTNILLWVEMEEIGVCCEVIGNIHDSPELLEVQNG